MKLPTLLEWYHHMPYNPLKIESIHNHPYCAKPIGGLWTSPVPSKRSWYKWCLNNDFGCLNNRVLFELRPCNVPQIHTLGDIRGCPLTDY